MQEVAGQPLDLLREQECRQNSERADADYQGENTIITWRMGEQKSVQMRLPCATGRRRRQFSDVQVDNAPHV